MSAWHLQTRAVALGRPADPGAPYNTPPTFASTYRDGGAVGYGRWGNPTWSAFEEALGALEGGSALAFASGQAAIAAVLETLPVGATVIAPSDAYLGTRGYLAGAETEARMRTHSLDVTDTAAVVAALPEADLLWLESPVNPLLGVVDLPTVLAAAAESGVPAIVDNTFATPLLQRPLSMGATAVIHSATKYIGGHSDLLLGVVATRDDGLLEKLLLHRTLSGAIPGTMEAWLALRGLRTLPLRMERAQASALALADLLAGHPAVQLVRYPGLAEDPGYQRCREHMDGPGAMVSFELESAEIADLVVQRLELIVGGTSLGGVETTIDRRERWPGEEAVPPGLLRVSVGIEHVDDLWHDLVEALPSSNS